MTVLTPEFLQTKSYSALRDRVLFQHGGSVQAGVWDAGDFKVSQRASSANMSVDVAAGYALVNANDPGNNGLYHVQNDATVNVPQTTAAHASLPRIDQLVLVVTDTTHGGDASDAGTLQWVTGTATSGTTLDLRTGAGTPPTGSLLLADVLVPAASSTMTTANIRDRRPWARGANAMYVLAATTGITSTTGVPVPAWGGRVELSGAPIEFLANLNTQQAGAASTAAPVTGLFAPALNGGVYGSSLSQTSLFNNQGYNFSGYWYGQSNPSPGSYVTSFYMSVSSTQWNAGAGSYFLVRERLGQTAPNT